MRSPGHLSSEPMWFTSEPVYFIVVPSFRFVGEVFHYGDSHQRGEVSSYLSM